MRSAAPLSTYLVAQLPGWILAALAAWLLHRWSGVSGWLAIAAFAGWVAKDLVLYPAMSRYYRPEPAPGRIVGEEGTAVTDLAPGGLVRVHGELWQARSDGHAPGGARIRVRAIHGLQLVVDVIRGDPAPRQDQEPGS